MSGTIDAARQHIEDGWALIPVYGMRDGRCACPGQKCGVTEKSAGKHPIGDKWQQRGIADALSWEAFAEAPHPGCNIGALTGRPSSRWVLDIDPDSDGDVRLKELEREYGPLPSTRTHRTGSGGVHYVWQMPADFAPTNRAGRLPDGIDVRGDGGQIVMPPSVSWKGEYAVISDAPIAPAPAWLLDLIRPPVRPEVKPGDRVAATPEAAGRLQKYALATLAGICEDMRACRARRNTLCWGKAADVVRLINAPWCGIDPQDAYERWEEAAYAHPDGVIVPPSEVEQMWRNGVRHAGDEQRELPPERESDVMTYIGGATLAVPAVAAPLPGTTPALGQAGTGAATAPPPSPGTVGDTESTGWTAVDITPVLSGERTRVEPTIGRRTDDVALLYPGKEHAIASEPECGKTWLAAIVVADVLKRGGRVVYVDFEDDQWTIVGERLMAPGIGVLPDRLMAAGGQFRYVRPETAPRAGEFEALLTFPTGAADLLVLDGVTEGMQLLGLEFGKYNETAAEWRRIMVKPALRLGTATLATDHVVKDKEARGGFAIGGQHKKAGLNGAMFMLEQGAPFGRGLKGRSKLYVSKDRNGGLRQHGEPAGPGITYFGDLVGDAESGEMASLALFPPFKDDAREDGMNRAELETARKVLAVLRAAAPRELGVRELEEAVKGRKGTITPAKQWLEQRGAILIQQRSNRVNHQYVKEIDNWD